MKNFFTAVLKALKKMLLIFVITSAAIVVISKVLSFTLSLMFIYIGVAYMIIGGFSYAGSLTMTSNIIYMQTRSVTARSNYESSVEDYKARDKSLGFQILIAIIGFALIITGSLLTVVSL